MCTVPGDVCAWDEWGCGGEGGDGAAVPRGAAAVGGATRLPHGNTTPLGSTHSECGTYMCMYMQIYMH